MNTTRPGTWTLHLNLLGIPIHIHPVSWIVLAIIGGGLGISDRDGLVQTLLFVAAGMLSLIVPSFPWCIALRAAMASSAGTAPRHGGPPSKPL